ncbi:MAG: hypothetical protein ACRC62_32875 [Microcoleus sp.]
MKNQVFCENIWLTPADFGKNLVAAIDRARVRNRVFCENTCFEPLGSVKTRFLRSIVQVP